MVQKVASVSVMAESLDEESATFLGLVLEVNLIVFSELVRSMSEFTPSVIGTESRVHVLFAQFQFLFSRVGSHMSSGSLIVIVGAIGVVSGVGVL